jgi:hypothetical protein
MVFGLDVQPRQTKPAGVCGLRTRSNAASNRVAADALVEEHLLACEECRARPAGFDAYIAATRETARSDA